MNGSYKSANKLFYLRCVNFVLGFQLSIYSFWLLIILHNKSKFIKNTLIDGIIGLKEI